MHEWMRRAMPLAPVVFAGRRSWYRLRYPHLTMGKGVMVIGHLHIRSGTRVHIGDHARIRGTVRITGGGDVNVGARTRMNGTWIVARKQVAIGEDCLISDCGITDTDFHNLHPEARHLEISPQASKVVTIGRNVWIGLSAIILKGSTIGDDSAIGAGAVVRGKVDARVVMTGNPAQIVKRFDMHPSQREVSSAPQ